MLESIKKIIDLVQLKANYEIQFAQSSPSVYLFKGDNVVRISDHFGGKYPINIITCEYDEGYCVIINRNTFYYKSARKVAELLINYYHFSDSFSFEKPILDLKAKERTLQMDLVAEKQTSSHLATQISNLNKKIKELENKLSSNTLTSNLKKKITELEKKLNDKHSNTRKLNQDLISYRNQIIELKKDCKEAAELIDILTNDTETRKLLTNEKEKKYYLDHFPKDVQTFLEEVIKEYYN